MPSTPEHNEHPANPTLGQHQAIGSALLRITDSLDELCEFNAYLENEEFLELLELRAAILNARDRLENQMLEDYGDVLGKVPVKRVASIYRGADFESFARARWFHF